MLYKFQVFCVQNFFPFISASEKAIMWPNIATWVSDLKIKKILEHWIKKQKGRGVYVLKNWSLLMLYLSLKFKKLLT